MHKTQIHKPWLATAKFGLVRARAARCLCQRCNLAPVLQTRVRGVCDFCSRERELNLAEMDISYVFLVSRVGKCRLARFYDDDGITLASRHSILKDVTALVTHRPLTATNVLFYKDTKVIYKR